MCLLGCMPFWGCRASSGHHNLYSTGPEGPVVFFLVFLVLRMPPLFLLGIGKTRKATLIRTYFPLYIGKMYKSVQLHAWNHKFPPRKHFWVITCFWGPVGFLGGQWIFWFTGPPGQWLPQSNVKACKGSFTIIDIYESVLCFLMTPPLLYPKAYSKMLIFSVIIIRYCRSATCTVYVYRYCLTVYTTHCSFQIYLYIRKYTIIYY